MDAGRVPSAAALDALAVAAGAAAGDADAPTPATTAAPLTAREGLVERLFGAPPSAADLSNAPARHVDHGAETGSVQTNARSDTPGQANRDAALRDGLARGDPAPTGAAHSGGDRTLAADQLVPATLVGLHAQPAWTMALPLPPVPHFATAEDEAPEALRRERDGGAAGDDDDEDDEDDAAGDASADSEAPPPESAEAADTVLDPADAAACAAVARALQAWLATPSRGTGAAPALSALLDQWQRGRCIVLACPQGPAPDGPAWAFVLRLRRAVMRPLDGQRADLHPADPRRRLLLAGRRFAARLQWRGPATAAAGPRWVHARLAKDHHPQRGRQLLPMGAAPGTAAPCTVQLGPALSEGRAPSELHLRVDAARRFWAALGDQWSVLVVGCSLPLALRPGLDTSKPFNPTPENRHARR